MKGGCTGKAETIGSGAEGRKTPGLATVPQRLLITIRINGRVLTLSTKNGYWVVSRNGEGQNLYML